MARSEIKTWLSLDEWFSIIGVNPLHANSLSSTLFSGNVCGTNWFQYQWQHSDRVSREDVAEAISEAENDIALEVGYNLIPDWSVEERKLVTRPLVPESYSLSGLNPRSMLRSIELSKGHVISGGVKTKTAIELGSAITRSDPNGDGYSELCTVSVATSVTDTNEIHVYYAGESGDDGWEIRPIEVSISGGIATITFKSWQVVLKETMDTFDAEAIDGDDATNYETTVDVYRVYNDPSTQVQFIWERIPGYTTCSSSTCVACNFDTQAGCFHLRDPRLGFAVPAPASWDSDDEEFDSAEWAGCRAPDQVRFWYYSGFQDKSILRYNVTMSRYWKRAVAYYAASRLDRPACGCSNVQQFIDHWRKDASLNTPELSFQVTPELMSNKFGTTMGAIFAYKAVHRNGVRIIK